MFLPQLLTYPNPADPLNSDAAALYMKDTVAYNKKVRDFVDKSIAKYEERHRARADSEKAPSVGEMSIGGRRTVGGEFSCCSRSSCISVLTIPREMSLSRFHDVGRERVADGDEQH